MSVLERIKQVSIIVLCLALTVSSIWITHRIDVLSRKAEEIAPKFEATITRTSEYVDQQLDRFESEAYQKSLKAGLDTPAVFNASGRYLNRFILPAFLGTVQTANRALATSDNAVARLDDLVRRSDVSLNDPQGLIPTATVLISSLNQVALKFEVTIGELSAAIKSASEKSGKSLDAIYALIADPKMQNILLHWDEMSASGAGILADVKMATEKAPSIAASLDSIAKTSSRYTKITLIANILSVLARAFLP